MYRAWQLVWLLHLLPITALAAQFCLARWIVWQTGHKNLAVIAEYPILMPNPVPTMNMSWITQTTLNLNLFSKSHTFGTDFLALPKLHVRCPFGPVTHIIEECHDGILALVMSCIHGQHLHATCHLWVGFRVSLSLDSLHVVCRIVD